MDLTEFQKDKLENCILKYLKSIPKLEMSKDQKPLPSLFLGQLAYDLKGRVEYEYILKKEKEEYEYIENRYPRHMFKSRLIVPVSSNGCEFRITGCSESLNKRISKEFSALDIIVQLNSFRNTQNHLIKILM